jgi:hypothetical protein
MREEVMTLQSPGPMIVAGKAQQPCRMLNPVSLSIRPVPTYRAATTGLIFLTWELCYQSYALQVSFGN